jgi:hypothetical protein
MNLVWQNAFVIGLVAVAILYVIRVAWLVVAKRKSGCGNGCTSCTVKGEGSGANQAKPFVSADELASTFRQHNSRRRS